MSGDPAFGRGGDGAGQGGPLFWNRGETGVPYAVQCYHHGHHLAYGCGAGYPAFEEAAGQRVWPSQILYVPQLSAVP